MYIVLDKNDCSKIIDAIIQSGESGTITSLVINGLSFGVCFDLEVEYSREDDYFNGTGAYVCESVYCSIMDIWLEEEDVAIDVDTTYIENEVEKHFQSRSKRMSVVVTFVMLAVGLSMLKFEVEGIHIGFSSLLTCTL